MCFIVARYVEHKQKSRCTTAYLLKFYIFDQRIPRNSGFRKKYSFLQQFLTFYKHSKYDF